MEKHELSLEMINNLGIGIDIIEVSRFRRKKYEENRNFYKKIFVKSEINYCLKFKNSAERFAGKFAIKEAVIKSIPEKIGPRDIEIVYVNRKPRIRLKNSLEKKYQELESKKIVPDKELIKKFPDEIFVPVDVTEGSVNRRFNSILSRLSKRAKKSILS